MTKTTIRNSSNDPYLKKTETPGKWRSNPIEIPGRVIPTLPLLYQALTEVLVQDGLVQLVSDDLPPCDYSEVR